MKRSKNAIVEVAKPVGRLIGYARVSTSEQSLDLQRDALLRAGVLPDNLHEEQVSGVAAKRPKLRAALLDAVDGDTFVVWKLDRLGRSMLDLLQRIEEMETRGVKFKSLTEGVDTTTPAGRLLMHMIGSLAQFERDLIRERTRAGMEAVRARGKKFGAPTKLKLAEARTLFMAGKSVQQVADHFKCSRSAVYNKFKFAEIEKLRAKGMRARSK